MICFYKKNIDYFLIDFILVFKVRISFVNKINFIKVILKNIFFM